MNRYDTLVKAVLTTFNLPEKNVYKVEKTSDSTWSVRNIKGMEYNVRVFRGNPACSCPDYIFHHNRLCKHIRMLGL